MGPARREGDLVGSHAEALGDDGAGVVEHQPRLAGRAVQSPRVGVPAIEGLQQHLAGRGVQRLARGVIEVRRNRGAGTSPAGPKRRRSQGKTYRRPARRSGVRQ